MSTSLVLQPGRIGISVNKMQGYLNLMRQRGMIQMALVEDGVYGANMSRAVREAQTYLGLPDGEITPDTVKTARPRASKTLAMLSSFALWCS